MVIDTKKLEDSLNGLAREEKKPQNSQMTRDEEIGFHKGTLNTLVAERAELVKIIGNVEAIMQAHLKRLKELGVELK